MPMSVCYCGQPWSPGQSFCTGCGTPLPESEAQHPAGESTPTPKNVRIRANNWVMWVLFAASLMVFLAMRHRHRSRVVRNGILDGDEGTGRAHRIGRAGRSDSRADS